MTVSVVDEPRPVHATPGRLRVHLPGWSGQGRGRVENHLREVPGVRGAEANPLTGNVLIRFDPRATDERAILRAARALGPEPANAWAGEPDRAAPPPALTERRGPARRARIAVRGLDRDPALARRVVERLERRPGVRRAVANPLTGRVLIDYVDQETTLHDLVSTVAELELPALPAEDRPAHPLEPGPLARGATRSLGAAAGLGLLAARRLAGAEGPPTGGNAPAVTASAIGLLQGFPAARSGLGRLVGPTVVDAALAAASIVSLTLAGRPLGLALAGLEAFRQLTAARTRRTAWRRHEEWAGGADAALPGARIRLEAGERTPLSATIRGGTGVATGRDGLPVPVAPGDAVPAGAVLYGGPFELALVGGEPFTPGPRPTPMAEQALDRYLRAMAPLSLAYGAATALLTRSLGRVFAALLLVSPRAAVAGTEAADAGASARLLRAGVTVVGTRPDRPVRLPDALLLHGPHVVTDGFEIAGVVPLVGGGDAERLGDLAAAAAAAPGSPWAGAFPVVGGMPASDGAFDGQAATAPGAGAIHTLAPVADWSVVPAAARLRHRGDLLLELRDAVAGRPLGWVALRPRLAAGTAALAEACRRHGVAIGMLAAGDRVAAAGVAARAGMPILDQDDPVAAVRARQAGGAVVAFVSDNADAAAAFAACDLAIGLAPGRAPLPARADLLAPDLEAVVAVLEAGARRRAAIRDGVALSAVGAGVGAVWGLRREVGLGSASLPFTFTALGALATAWARLRGGERVRSVGAEIADPHPERWGHRGVADALRAFATTEAGLTDAEAARRRQSVPPVPRRRRLLAAILDQLRSPLTGILAAGAGLSLVLGAPADVAMIGAMIVANAAAGAWQEARADQAAEALERMGTAIVRVLRDGRTVTASGDELVPGDVILVVAGDRVAADARLLAAHGLEVDEAALTGESLPVPKRPDGPTAGSRILLEGSDVVAGTGRAVVVAVGRQTRMGSIAAALARDEPAPSPLGTRLNRMLRQVLPVAAAGGGIVAGSGLWRGGSPAAQLAIGASIAIAAVPEGLPVLAKIGEAAVARRLSDRHALVHRLAAVEALGRVDIACTDKTGTLTEGRLRLRVVADLDHEVAPPAALPADLRRLLLTAALAGPHPDALDAATDRTDVAVSRAAQEAGFGDELRVPREAQSAFDSVRLFHAALAQGRLCVEGAVEALVPRCDRVRRGGEEWPLDDAARDELLGRARRLGERGLRVLMVAEGPPAAAIGDPRGLVALGFVGLSDPLRAGVPAAVRRCHEAGVRVIMLTGDHPATARAIAREAGLPDDDRGVLTGADIAGVGDAELDRRLERATIIARATPLDKLRIVESLQRLGHSVAMTGDGVNDAPALRLADVGVAMGRGGTEVARQAADVVLADDDFSTLVETLVEGRSFWRNIRQALGLLLGGNLGELGLQVAASLLGLAAPLTSRQVLAMNLITDVLPALAVALQQPAHHDLAGLAREGTSALGGPLRDDILRRGAATAAPAFAAYAIALRHAGIAGARTVAFASIVATQLAQTLDVGRGEGGLSRSVVGAVAGSTGLLLAVLAVPPLPGFLALATPTPLGVALVGASALAAVLLGRLFSLSSLGTPGHRPQSAAGGGLAS